MLLCRNEDSSHAASLGCSKIKIKLPSGTGELAHPRLTASSSLQTIGQRDCCCHAEHMLIAEHAQVETLHSTH